MQIVMMGRLLCGFVLLGLLAGCGGIGSGFDNFTAYYNKFYNAKKSYSEGIKTLEQANEPVDPSVFLPLFTAPGRAANVQQFESAIKKSADVLREHPSSKWVDDALLLIGQAYFYQQNYVGAEQKFREVIKELDPQKKSQEREDEARFWLARTLIASGAYDEAALHLQESLAREELSDRWAPMLHLALGELYVTRGEWEQAGVELALGLEEVDDGDLAARSEYLLGQVYEKMGRYEEARDAYHRVQRHNPLYELAYAARLSELRVEGLRLSPEEALRELQRMESDDKNYSNRAELAFMRGRVLQRAGQPDEAFRLYHWLLYDADADADISKVRGRIHYALGELYRDDYRDFFRAAAHFDTAWTTLGGVNRSVNGARGGQERYTASAIVDSKELAAVFGNFAAVQQEVNGMDSLLYLGSLDDEAFEEAILEVRRQLAQERERQRRLMEEQQAQRQFAQIGREGLDEDERSLADASAQETAGAGFLFHKDPARIQEGRLSFLQRWGNRPLRPNWRRRAAIAASSGEDGPGQDSLTVAEAGGLGATSEALELPVVDVSAVPRDSASQARLRAERALKRYELGNVLFLSMNRPDSAAAWYRLVIDEDGDQPVAQRAYYALAEVHRSLGDTLAARRLYQQVVAEYPHSEFAVRLQEQLGLREGRPAEQAAEVPAEDAEQAYARVYADWQRGRYASALSEMVRVAVQYRDSEVAPRALLAAGSIYSEWAVRDSLDLFAPLPLDVPDTLLSATDLFDGGTDAAAPSQTATTMATPDSAAAEALSQAASPSDARSPVDTLAAVVDTLAAPVDTLATAVDTLGLPAVDSLAAQAVLPDSLRQGETEALTGAQAAAAPGEGLRLETLYASLVRHYPDAPQAARAQDLLRVLEERRPRPVQPADSVEAGPGMLAAADSLAPSQASIGATDSVQVDVAAHDTVAVVADTVATAEEMVAERLANPLARRRALESGAATAADSSESRTRPPEEPAAEDPAPPGLRGTQPVSPQAGGWTIVVASFTNPMEAQGQSEQLFRQGYRVGFLEEEVDGAKRYRVSVGQFESEQEAGTAQAYLVEEQAFSDDIWLHRLTVKN